MANVGELSVDVKARINDFSKNLNTALGQANSFATRMSTIGKKDYFAPVQESLKGMSRDFKQIIQGIILAQTFYQGLQLFKDLTAAVYEYTDALNYAKVTFSNLFRDASLGEEFVAVLQQYAARSPFDFTDIEKGARQLSAYGIQAKNLMYVMEGIGNLSAVTGDPQTFETVSRAMGQIYSKGKLTAEEMRQLAEAGLNVKEVYARLGVTSENIGKANIDAATALNTIVEVLNDTYAGAMSAANTTMRGMLANTKDVLLSVSSAVFQPAYEKLQRVLKWIQIGLDEFQKTFSTENLAAAIEQAFGEGTVNKIQRFIAICQYLGNLLYQLLAPALRIVGMYGETFLTVFTILVRVLGPVLQVFAALLNSFVNSAEGARLLQAALMGLVVVKMVGGLVELLTAGFALMSKAMAGVTSVAAAASGALTILTGAEAGAAAGAYGAAAAWKYFTKTLNINPIVLVVTIILSLITAVLGLRAVLSQTSESIESLSGTNFDNFLQNIKQATGDAEKFKQPFEDTTDNIDDVNKGLDKTKKKLEGLLSFDEVFKIPEKADTDVDTDTDTDKASIPDLGAFDLSNFDIEPLNPWDLLPDISGILDWLKEQPWYKIGEYISKGIYSGLKAAKKLPTKAIADLLDDLLKTAGKKLDKFSIKERVAKLAEKAAESRSSFRAAGKELSDALYEYLEKELGPKKAKKLKLKERISAIAEEAAKGEKAWKETGSKLAKALDKEIMEELGQGLDIEKYMSDLAKDAEKANKKFAKAGERLAKQLTSEIKEYLGPAKAKELKISENLEKIIQDAVKGGKVWEEAGAESALKYFESLNIEFAKGKIDPNNIEKSVAELAKELKSNGVRVTSAGRDLSDDFIRSIEEGLTSNKSFGDIATTFGKNFIEAFKSLPKNISEELSKGFSISGIFEGISKSFTDSSGESIFKAFMDPIKKAFTPARIVEFLKTGLKDMGITIIGEMLFDELEAWLDSNGQTEAANVVDRIGPILASALGTGIATKSPWGFVAGAIWGALFEDLGRGLETGDWSSFIGQASGSLGVILSKIAPRLGAASAGGPAGWIGAIGSMVSDLIFGSIIQNLRDSGDTQTADMLDAIDGAVGGALGGAGLGATIGSIFPGIGTAIGAVAGAIIGGLVGFLTDNWEQVADWWNNTVVPWFQDLPNKFGEFLTNADQWLSDPTKNPLAGVWNGIKEVWTGISEFFSGIYDLIVGFFTDDGTLLHDAGYKIMDGLWNGICGVWDIISSWFLAIPQHLLAFFTGDDSWLTADGMQILNGLLNGLIEFFTNIGQWFLDLPGNIQKFFTEAPQWLIEHGVEILTGLLGGITNFWGDIVQWFKDLPDNIGKFFENAIDWLVDAGTNILSGFFDGIQQKWKDVADFFSGIGEWIQEHKGPEEYDKQLLVPAGQNIIGGFLEGLQNKFRGVQSFIGSIGNNIVGSFKESGGWLSTPGSNIVAGLSNGISAAQSYIVQALQNVGNLVAGAFSNAGTWLNTAGSNIMAGLYNGLVSSFSRVQSFVGSIGSWIAQHKGPEEYDKKLLIPNGTWIMEGLETGLTNQFADILKLVSNFGPQMDRAFVAPVLTVSAADMPSYENAPIPRAIMSSAYTPQQAPQEQVEEVANPYLTTDTATNDKPIMYVGTLIADKQGLRELQRKLDVINLERNRYK